MNSPYYDFLRMLGEQWIVPHVIPALSIVCAAFMLIAVFWAIGATVRLLSSVIPKLIAASLVIAAGVTIGVALLTFLGR